MCDDVGTAWVGKMQAGEVEGRTDVDLGASDVERAAVQGGGLGHAQDSMLGGRIGGRVRARGVCGDRTVVDDAALEAKGRAKGEEGMTDKEVGTVPPCGL